MPEKKKRESVVKLPFLNCVDVLIDLALVNRFLKSCGVFLLTLGKNCRVLLFIFPAFQIRFKSSSLAGFVTQYFDTAINLAGSGIQFYGVAVLLDVVRRFFSRTTSGGRFSIYRFHKS